TKAPTDEDSEQRGHGSSDQQSPDHDAQNGPNSFQQLTQSTDYDGNGAKGKEQKAGQRWFLSIGFVQVQATLDVGFNIGKRDGLALHFHFLGKRISRRRNDPQDD